MAKNLCLLVCAALPLLAGCAHRSRPTAETPQQVRALGKAAEYDSDHAIVPRPLSAVVNSLSDFAQRCMNAAYRTPAPPSGTSDGYRLTTTIQKKGPRTYQLTAQVKTTDLLTFNLDHQRPDLGYFMMIMDIQQVSAATTRVDTHYDYAWQIKNNYLLDVARGTIGDCRSMEQ